MDFWCFLMCFLRGFFCFSRLRCYKHFLAFFSPSPKAGNQSPKIEDQSSLGVLGKISRYRSISENTYSIFSYIFQGFGGSRFNPILISTGLISSSQEFPHSFPDHPDGVFGIWQVCWWLAGGLLVIMKLGSERQEIPRVQHKQWNQTNSFGVTTKRAFLQTRGTWCT